MLHAPPVVECRFDHAEYVDQAGAGFSIRPEGPSSSSETGDVRLTIRSSVSGVTYRFQTSTGNGYSTTTLNPISGPDTKEPAARWRTTIAAYAFHRDLKPVGDFPTASDPAPAYLLIPELGSSLWYMAEDLGGPSLTSGLREVLPRAFFELTRCHND